MIESYRLLAKKVDYPLHLGVTHAGMPYMGTIKNAIGIGTLVAEGIGDTIRVSLTGDTKEEVRAGFSILRAVGKRKEGPEIISCPTCGRTEIDLIGLAEKVEEALRSVKKPIKVAIMGCVVNGPGEAREADIGVAGGKGMGAIFAKGKVIKSVQEKDILNALLEEIEKLWLIVKFSIYLQEPHLGEAPFCLPALPPELYHSYFYNLLNYVKLVKKAVFTIF